MSEMTTLPFFVTIVVLTLLHLANANHEDGFQKLGSGYYYFGNKASTWFEAQRECALRKSTLVSIESDEESLALLDGIKKLTGDNNTAYWTGGIDYIDSSKRIWHWMENGNDMEKYKNWCPNEPNNIANNEHCMHITRTKDQLCWNDLDCMSKICGGCITRNQDVWYICEKKDTNDGCNGKSNCNSNSMRCSWECTTSPTDWEVTEHPTKC